MLSRFVSNYSHLGFVFDVVKEARKCVSVCCFFLHSALFVDIMDDKLLL